MTGLGRIQPAGKRSYSPRATGGCLPYSGPSKQALCACIPQHPIRRQPAKTCHSSSMGSNVYRGYLASGSASMSPNSNPPGSAHAANHPIPGIGIFGSIILPPAFSIRTMQRARYRYPLWWVRAAVESPGLPENPVAEHDSACQKGDGCLFRRPFASIAVLF